MFAIRSCHNEIRGVPNGAPHYAQLFIIEEKTVFQNTATVSVVEYKSIMLSFSRSGYLFI